ncbi:MAG: hypothetical protein AAGL10_00195 [Pseudomonadota bacterium]
MLKFGKTLLAASALCMGSAAMASDGNWMISDADGQVTVTRDSKPLYGASGTVLKAGDVITTSKTARAVLVRGGKFVVVEPSKKVRISKPKQKGAVAKVFEYLGNMVSTGSNRNTFGQQTAAAVIKGYGKGAEKSLSYSSKDAGYANTNMSQDDDPSMWKPVEPQDLKE